MEKCTFCGRYIDEKRPEKLIRKGHIQYFHYRCARELDRILDEVMELGNQTYLLVEILQWEKYYNGREDMTNNDDKEAT